MKREIYILSLLVVFGFGFFTNHFLINYKNNSCGQGMKSECKMMGDKNMHMMSDGKMMHDNHMTMETMMHDMNANLRDKTGDELDRAFLEEMIVHHEGAIEMANLLKDGTQRPELIKLADDIVSAQTKEIIMMKEWKLAWFGIN
jgi:uncharacterized protein (DUF305 family)